MPHWRASSAELGAQVSGGLIRHHQRRPLRRSRASRQRAPSRRRAPIPHWSSAHGSITQAQRDGNWALYGEEIKLLGETLRGMSK